MSQLLKRLVLTGATALVLAACLPDSSTNIDNNRNNTDFNWNIPEQLPLPIDPPDNPASEEKFQLGRHLFYDKRLSLNGNMSCANCHIQEKAFSDGFAIPQGATGETLARNSQALVNSSYNATYTWANSSLVRLEKQILIPLFSETPIEHGIDDSNRDSVLANLSGDPRYQSLFQEAFQGNIDNMAFEHIVDSLAVFVRGINSFNSPYDAYLDGDDEAISASAKRGEQLFFGERFECFHCHGGYNFTDSLVDSSMVFIEKPFHNTGLYNIDGNGAYPENNTGLMEVSNLQTDMGKFRAPSLRNVAVTAPYTHDGSVSSLREMLEIYAAGGRVIESGTFAGDGRNNPFKDGLITGFDASEQDFEDVISFLNSLTDEHLLANKRFSNPWEN